MSLSHFEISFKKYIFFLLLVLFAGAESYAQSKCEKIFSEKVQPAHSITNIQSLGKAMTEGMLLNQADIFDIYRKQFFGDPKTDLNRKNLDSVLEILKTHPELKKEAFFEYNISYTEKIYEAPVALSKYIRSKIISAGQTRSNLFQIEANLGFWKKILDYHDPFIPENLNKEQQKEFQLKSRTRFETYLNKIISRSNRDLLANLKNENQNYDSKAKSLFKTLQYIETWMSKKGRNVQGIRLAMVDVVNTIGFGNQSTQLLLKSTNALENIEGLKKLQDERDNMALQLGYAGHYQQLVRAMKIDSAKASSANIEFQADIINFEREVVSSHFSERAVETIRVRNLSIQEAPFRSCLGGSDCSSRTYFSKALDPNFQYFTMTDSNYHSSGHATVVLGEAINIVTGRLEKVAFVDKIQNVPNQKMKVFLAAIALAVKDNGYALGLPLKIGDHNGISNTDTIRHYIQNNILSQFQQKLLSFTPHQNNYNFTNAYSRAYDKIDVLIFDTKNIPRGINVARGEKHNSYYAESNIEKMQLMDDFLKLKISKNPEDLVKFINSFEIVRDSENLGVFSRKDFFDDLWKMANDEQLPIKLRKQAGFGLSIFENRNLNLNTLAWMEKLAPQIQLELVGEILTFKESTQNVKKSIYNQIVSEKLLDYPLLLESYLKNTAADVRALANAAAFRGNLEILKKILSRKNADVNSKFSNNETPILVSAVFAGNLKIAEFLLDFPNIDVNASDAYNGSALVTATNRGLSNIVELLLKQRNIDVNAKDRYGSTALMSAARLNKKAVLEQLLKDIRIDVNEKDNNGNTAFILASEAGSMDAMDLLLKHPKTDAQLKNNSGKNALDSARDKYRTLRALEENKKN